MWAKPYICQKITYMKITPVTLTPKEAVKIIDDSMFNIERVNALIAKVQDKIINADNDTVSVERKEEQIVVKVFFDELPGGKTTDFTVGEVNTVSSEFKKTGWTTVGVTKHRDYFNVVLYFRK